MLETRDKARAALPVRNKVKIKMVQTVLRSVTRQGLCRLSGAKNLIDVEIVGEELNSPVRISLLAGTNIRIKQNDVLERDNHKPSLYTYQTPNRNTDNIS